MKLTIVMPVFNEAARVADAIAHVLAVQYPCPVELIVVDDGSRDRTAAILADIRDPRMRLLTHRRNRGKGAAINTAVATATGEYLVIFDADLEYDAQDIPHLLAPILSGRAEVVYGNRTFGSHTSYSFWYVMGNKAVTLAANVLFNSYIGDLETCFKVMPVALYRSLRIRSQGFGVEAELSAKLLRRGIRPFEVPISYRARTREEGKKITWRDGVEALWILGRERARPRR
ncbi:glycosyl transferase family 2 [Stackebrandtia albiflava]|uniref:Glycosyl transferase family 2 n=1 Tax=Stackebrandtia albiflava TaxID=406432 RepID=A0A562UQQ8_9ACTN|nr:glycosyltransferase family 2 protein [Stackebrandtia albiflava]TWJ07936.1 glycosyl transferase family 2 [Stackebrandtia albiflava]